MVEHGSKGDESANCAEDNKFFVQLFVDVSGEHHDSEYDEENSVEWAEDAHSERLIGHVFKGHSDNEQCEKRDGFDPANQADCGEFHGGLQIVLRLMATV